MHNFDKISGNKHSGMENTLAKFRCPKMFAMETVTDSLFFLQFPISQQGVKVLP